MSKPRRSRWHFGVCIFTLIVLILVLLFMDNRFIEDGQRESGGSTSNFIKKTVNAVQQAASGIMSKACNWTRANNTFSGRFADDDATKFKLVAAKEKCLQNIFCKAVTCDRKGDCTLRASSLQNPSEDGETSYYPTQSCFAKGRLKQHGNTPSVWIGVLTAPGEIQRRAEFRSGCAASWQEEIDSGLLRWRFFVGEPESKVDTDNAFATMQGSKVSVNAHEDALKLINESKFYRDLDIGSYGDHYTTIHRKVFHIIRAGSEEAWKPDFVVKMDIDMCFKYNKFLEGWRDYMEVYRRAPMKKGQHRRNTKVQLEFIYRPSENTSEDFSMLRGSRRKQTSKIVALGDKPNFFTNFYSQFFSGAANNSLQYARRTNYSRQILALFSVSIFMKAVYTSQLGYTDTFEPYPSGPCYAMSFELAKLITAPENRASTVLMLDTYGTTSEDVNVGYWISSVTEKHQLQVDMLTITGGFAYGIEKPARPTKVGQADDTIRMKLDSSLCLNAETGKLESGNKIRIYTCTSAPHEQFVFRSSDSTIRVKSKPELCLNADHGGLKSGDGISLYTCSAAPNEQFVFHGDGTIRSKVKPAMCFNAEGKHLASGDSIILYTCSGDENERFTVEAKPAEVVPLSKLKVFIGIPSEPSEVAQRQQFRTGCAPKMQKAKVEARLHWRFFVNQPHGQDGKSALALLGELAREKDIEVIEAGDQKLFEVLHVGTTRQHEWEADIIVPLDINSCFDYDSFTQAYFEYQQSYRRGAMRSQSINKWHVLEMVYRPTAGKPAVPKSSWPASPYTYDRISIAGSAPSTYDANTDSTRVVMPVFSKKWVIKPRSYNNFAFEPHADSLCYALPRNLAKIMLTMKSKENLTNHTSMGKLLSGTTAMHRSQLDLVTSNRICPTFFSAV